MLFRLVDTVNQLIDKTNITITEPSLDRPVFHITDFTDCLRVTLQNTNINSEDVFVFSSTVVVSLAWFQ